jgi:hypothetical protein
MVLESIQGWLATYSPASEPGPANMKPPGVRSKKLLSGATPNGVAPGMHEHHTQNDEVDTVPIAIVGMSFRFPRGLESAESFWEALAEGRSAWSTFPSSRIHFDGVYDPDQERLNGVGASHCF